MQAKYFSFLFFNFWFRHQHTVHNIHHLLDCYYLLTWSSVGLSKRHDGMLEWPHQKHCEPLKRNMLQYKEKFLFFSDEILKFIELSCDSINVPNASRWILCTKSIWTILFSWSQTSSFTFNLKQMLLTTQPLWHLSRKRNCCVKGKEKTMCE